MSTTPTFKTPPVVELILGAQFSSLTKLTAGHFGLFWKELGDEWPGAFDAQLIDDHFELFDTPRSTFPSGLQFRLEPVRLPGRFMLENSSKDRRVQFQSTQFHLNWRKHDNFYPSYKNLIEEFESTFDRFVGFVEKSGLGEVSVNQWELTYIDSFRQHEYWETPAEWASILPGLLRTPFTMDNPCVSIEALGAEWAYEIEPKRGRLHIVANQGRVGLDRSESLLLQMTARGPVGRGGAGTLREGLDLGHDVAVRIFPELSKQRSTEKVGVVMIIAVSSQAQGAASYVQADNRQYSGFDESKFATSDDFTEPSQAWSLVIDQLLRIRKLEDDWDGEGTEAPHPNLVDRAIVLAERLKKSGMEAPSRVHAGVNSTIYFEWYSPLEYREIEVITPAHAEYRRVIKGSDYTEVVEIR